VAESSRHPATQPSRQNGAQRVRLTFPAKAEYITLARLALSGLVPGSLSDEALGDLKLAVTEACSNAVRHAYEEHRAGTVEIVYELRPDRLVVEVADNGRGFDPALRANEEGALTEGGLGIAIIRSLMDEFAVAERGGGRGSVLRFAKLLSG
jgi:serine/threonine-protein kinase RsbW